MPTFKTAGAADSEYTPPYDEDEIIDASLADVEFHTFNWNNPKTGKVETVNKLRWKFLITEDGPMKGKELQGETTTNFAAHPNCKAYNWYVKISGHSPAEGEEADTDDLVGLPCRVVIGHQKDKKEEGRIWLRVKDVFPKKSRATAPSPSEAPF